MPLKLPRWEDLSRDEQVPIYNLPLSNDYVITGGPGTGKTVLALFRASRIKSELQNIENQIDNKIFVQFLVFNRPLMLYLKRALEELGLKGKENLSLEEFLEKIKNVEVNDNIIFNAQTWHSWFYNFFPDRVPEIEKYKPDWEKIMGNKKFLEKIEQGPIWDYLIIDEAQDLPSELLKVLKKLTKKLTIFADPNQSIFTYGTSIQEILRIFEAGERRYYLTRNYRNTREIFEAAKIFYTGDRANIPAEPIINGNKPFIINCNDQKIIFKRIINYYENNVNKNIGIILPDNSSAKKFYVNFSNYLKKVDNNDFKLLIYDRNNLKEFNFDDSSIRILYFNVMKGLEFDTVFIPNITDNFFSREEDYKNNMMYVALTRAKDDVFIFYDDNYHNSFVYKKIASTKNKDLFRWE